jgi:serine/threonine protein kinase
MCISAHKELLDKAKILHRDISINNVMINIEVRAAQSSTSMHPHSTQLNNQSASIPFPIRKGLLIDFDYATYYEGAERKVSKGHRTVRENS